MNTKLFLAGLCAGVMSLSVAAAAHDHKGDGEDKAKKADLNANMAASDMQLDKPDVELGNFSSLGTTDFSSMKGDSPLGMRKAMRFDDLAAAPDASFSANRNMSGNSTYGDFTLNAFSIRHNPSGSEFSYIIGDMEIADAQTNVSEYGTDLMMYGTTVNDIPWGATITIEDVSGMNLDDDMVQAYWAGLGDSTLGTEKNAQIVDAGIIPMGYSGGGTATIYAAILSHESAGYAGVQVLNAIYVMRAGNALFTAQFFVPRDRMDMLNSAMSDFFTGSAFPFDGMS